MLGIQNLTNEINTVRRVPLNYYVYGSTHVKLSHLHVHLIDLRLELEMDKAASADRL